MKITLEYITPDAENFIGKMAGICYDAKSNREACLRRAKKCSEDGHLATLRFASAVFNVSGISRVCSHQFVRSKHLDFLQRSQRYCKEIDTEVVYPSGYNQSVELAFADAYMLAQTTYQYLLDHGVKKEDARYVLPEATHTELNVVGNLQAWKDFIRLRADKHAQAEIRQVAVAINNILSEQCPNLFERM